MERLSVHTCCALGNLQYFLTWWKRPFFCRLGAHTHRGNHQWYFGFGCRYLFPLVHFFEACLVFSGHPPLGYDVSSVFLLPRVKFARSFLAPGLFWGLSKQVCLCFSVPWTNCLVSGRPAVLLFCIVDPHRHIFEPAGAEPTNSEANGVIKSIVAPPPGTVFGPFFVICSYLSETCDL